MSARLQLQELSYRYGGHEDSAAIADLSLDVAPGELVAMLGPSGCGKTTSLKLICGLLEPAHGDVRIDGRSVLGLPPEQRDIAMVFQKGLLFEHMDVAANVGFGLRMRGLSRAQTRPAVANALDQVQMATFGSRRPRELSSGQAQRVALARALVTEPRVMLLDEPLSALDAALRDEMRTLVRRLQKEGDYTTVFVTHDQQEAIRLADRVALIFDGRLQMFAPPDAFYRRPASRRVAEFFGARNFIAGSINGGQLHTAFGDFALDQEASLGRCTATIRPEAVRLGRGENAVQARVVEANYRGTHISYRCHCQGQTIVADLAPDTGLNVGDRTWLRLPRDALWVFENRDDERNRP